MSEITTSVLVTRDVDRRQQRRAINIATFFTLLAAAVAVVSYVVLDKRDDVLLWGGAGIGYMWATMCVPLLLACTFLEMADQRSWMLSVENKRRAYHVAIVVMGMAMIAMLSGWAEVARYLDNMTGPNWTVARNSIGLYAIGCFAGLCAFVLSARTAMHIHNYLARNIDFDMMTNEPVAQIK